MTGGKEGRLKSASGATKRGDHHHRRRNTTANNIVRELDSNLYLAQGERGFFGLAGQNILPPVAASVNNSSCVYYVCVLTARSACGNLLIKPGELLDDDDVFLYGSSSGDRTE